MKLLLKVVLYLVSLILGLFGIIEVYAFWAGGQDPIFQLVTGVILLAITGGLIKLARK